MPDNTPPPKDRSRGLTHLHSVQPAEVSLVGDAANKRRFLFRKNKKGTGTMGAESVVKGGPGSGPQGGEGKTQSGKTIPHGVPDKKDPHATANYIDRTAGFTHQDHVDAAEHHEKAANESKSSKDRASMRGIANYHRNMAQGGVHKSASGAVVKMKSLVSKTDPKLMADAESLLTAQPGQIGAEALAGGKALVRILSPLKGQLPPELAHRLVDMAAGEDFAKAKRHEIDEDDDNDEGEDGEVGGIKKSALSGAAKAANGAFYEHLSKMGYSGRPTTHVSMNLGGETVRKSKGEQVADKTAADGKPDLSGATPEVRERIEGVLKAQEELVAKNAQLTTQNADLEKRLGAMEASNRRQELVTKAAGWKSLGIPQEDIVAQLEMADKQGKENLERVQKNFDALNAQASQASLFTERGSPLSRAGAGGAGGADPYSRIEAAAEGWVAKSGKTMSKDEATAAFLQTPDGQRMYAEYKNARPEGA